MGGVAAFDGGDDGFECILTADRATAAKAAEDGWDRGLREVSDKGDDEKAPR